nr:AAA family ATPase [Rickettsiales bacterium]
KAKCIWCKIAFNEEYNEEYNELIKITPTNVKTIPIEYYNVEWQSCARENMTYKSIPLKSVLIDSSSARYQNGSDVYISRIIKNNLKGEEKVAISQTYRKMKETFMSEDSIKKINEKINNESKITEHQVNISVDFSSKDAWENSLMTYLDKIPFHQIGKGEQCIIKTNLALAHKKTAESNVILIEEPENHLSYTTLNKFIKNIELQSENKQMIISTHSSFIANKLGLETLILLNNNKTTRLNELKKETFSFFKKLPDFKTLRLLMGKKTILVEGPSDELIVQKAYMSMNNGKLPIEDGIDVISVGICFKRFLEIAEKIDKNIAVVTDNDGDYENKIAKKYSEYGNSKTIKIFADNDNTLPTLEPQFINANKDNLKKLYSVVKNGSSLDKEEDDLSKDDLSKYMLKNKTNCALSIFESEEEFKYPSYIKDVIEWCK